MNRRTPWLDLLTAEQESSPEQKENDDIVALFDRFPSLGRIALDIRRGRGRCGDCPPKRTARQ
jgi:hypothetical protein